MKIGNIEDKYDIKDFKAERGPHRNGKYMPLYDMKPGDSVQVRIWPFSDHDDFKRQYRILAANLWRIGKIHGGKFAIRTVDETVGKLRVWRVK